jgi:hypothetical protein
MAEAPGGGTGLLVRQYQGAMPVYKEARTLYEAVGRAIERFRRCEHVTYDPKGLHEFVVESREPGTQHRLTRNMFDASLSRPGGSPADVALKTRLKSLLGGTASGGHWTWRGIAYAGHGLRYPPSRCWG